MKVISIFAMFFVLIAVSCTPKKDSQGSSKLTELQSRSAANGWTFKLGESDYTKKLSANGNTIRNELKIPAKKSKSLSDSARLTYLESGQADRPLPTSWDWRWFDVVTEVRQQGTCGSCWAFGTVASLESAIMIQTPRKKIHISEQELVSCSDYGSCGGGYFAMEYYLNRGATYNEEFPYQGADVQCRASSNGHEKAADWAMVGGGDREATVDELKRAIYDFGPVAATVEVTDSWSYYQGGTFNGCDGMGRTNHIVTIVGWDDKDQVWIIKNSHGTDWGDGGYMRSKWNDASGNKCNGIGESAAYVVFDPKTNTVKP